MSLQLSMTIGEKTLARSKSQTLKFPSDFLPFCLLSLA